MSLILPASSSPELKAFPLLQVFQIFRGRAGRDCVFHFVPATDSPDTRFSVMAAVVLSGCLCQSRKDPYLPLEPLSVRLLPRPTGLPPMAFAVSFRIRCRGRGNRRQTPQAYTHSPAWASSQVHPHLPPDGSVSRIYLY